MNYNQSEIDFRLWNNLKLLWREQQNIGLQDSNLMQRTSPIKKHNWFPWFIFIKLYIFKLIGEFSVRISPLFLSNTFRPFESSINLGTIALHRREKVKTEIIRIRLADCRFPGIVPKLSRIFINQNLIDQNWFFLLVSWFLL